MSRYAEIINGVAVNVIESASPPGGNWVLCQDKGSGWGFDGQTWTPPPSQEPRHITVLAFLNRFTQAERIATDLASIDNPSATLPQRQQAAALRDDLARTKAAIYIDLDRADTRAGVQLLETAGLIAAGRAAVILDSPIAPQERYERGL